MSTRPSPRRAALLPGAVLLVALVAACTPTTSDGGMVVVTTDDRVAEVREAREALAEPVPAFSAQAERLVDALRDVWTSDGSSQERANLGRSLRTEPFREALEVLAAVELEGGGPDVEAASAVVAAMVADGEELLEVVEQELSSLDEVPPFDEELEGLLSGWDARGSYSQQLEAFEQLAVDAEELATDAAGREAVPTCVEIWPRRAEAATVVAERTRELHALIRDRQGQQFDELRDEYRQDPYGYGSFLGVLDGEAAAACWDEASAAPGLADQVAARVEELATALDPPELRG